jgi:hypothetical protein
MKKNYILLLLTFAFISFTNAQSLTIDFSDSSYDPATNAGVETDLNNHPDWNSQGSWNADIANTQIKILQANWKRSTYKTAIKAAAGEVVSLTLRTKLGTDIQPFQDAEPFVFFGFQATDAATGTSNNSNRDGVLIRSSDVAGNEVFLATQGNSAFATNPTISQADKNTYEVLYELVIGTDAATTIIRSRLRNVASDETSAVSTTTGINSVVYDAFVGTGAHLLIYGWNPFVGAFGTDYQINQVYILNEITITVDGTGVLSTEKINSFEFNTYPNPVSNVLNINSQETIQSVEVFNLLGKKVLSTKNVNGSLDVSSLSKSVYILKLTSDNGVSTKRFVKQ